MSVMSLESLRAAIYEDLNAHVLSVSSDGSRYHVEIECDDWQGAGFKRRFRLTFSDVAEATVTPGWFGNLIVEIEHPLLWKYNDEHLSMYFSTAPAVPLELIGELYERHRGLFSDWRALSETLHADSARLQCGHGLFAQGPRRVIEEYARIVAGRLKYSIVAAYVPKGGYSVALFDSTFVVCRSSSVAEIAVN